MKSRTQAQSTTGARGSLEGDGSTRARWRYWGDVLRRHRLDGIAAWLLDAGRPVALLSAQLLYMGTPLLGAGAERLAAVLESDEAADFFVSYLEPETLIGQASKTGKG